jgi:hypothetical protein
VTKPNVDIVGREQALDLASAYFEAERMIVERIAKYVAKGLEAPTWEYDSLARAQALRAETTKIVAQLSKMSAAFIDKQVKSLYHGAVLSTVSDLGKNVPHFQAASLTKRNSVAVITRELNSKTDEIGRALLRRSDDVFRSTVGKIVQTTAARGISRTDGAKYVMNELGKQGIGSFVDASGRNWSLGSYVDMATRTGFAKAQIQGHVDTLIDNDMNLVYVQPGPRACDICDDWANAILSLDGSSGDVETTNVVTGEPMTVEVDASLEEAQDEGFQHPNCRCSISAYLPGATDPSIIDRPEWDAEGYAAQQQQRSIERDIRGAKMEAAAAIDAETKAAAESAVRDQQARMRDHLAANPDLKRRSDRESISGRFSA